MDKKLRAGRIPKEPEVKDLNLSQTFPEFRNGKIRPENILGITPNQLFIISLEIFLLVLFVGIVILKATGKFS